MGPVDAFEDPEDTEDELMRATYDALCEHGYANLTVQRIGDEFPKSKSLVYQHYDGKDDLLLSFLAYLLEQFRREVPDEESAEPRARLEGILDHVVGPGEHDEFTRAMVELRAQAAHDDAYRRHFTRSDRLFRDHIADVIAAGIAAGEFRDVDPEQTAAALVTLLNGALVERATSDGEALLADVRAELEAVLEARLFARDPDHP